MTFRKYILVLLLLSISIYLAAETRLGMFIDVKRYLDANRNTKMVIDYQVPYKNMMFKERGSGFYAELEVDIQIAYPDSETYIPLKTFTNNVGVSRKYDLTSQGKSYIDRISLTPPQSGFKLRIMFIDVFSEKSYLWKYTTENLLQDDLISDLEIIREINPDTTMYSQKFKRNNSTHIPEIAGLIPGGSTDSLYVFCEYYKNFDPASKATLTIYRDSTAVLISTQHQEQFLTLRQIIFPVNIAGFEAGHYKAMVDFVTKEKKARKEVSFAITEQSEIMYFLFTDSENEFQFIRDLAVTKSLADWRSMSNDAQRRYISNFWQNFATKQGKPVADILDLYKKRIDYCNNMFSHFEQGWKSDMGRIYIRNGAPDETESDTSSDDTRFVRKDYQIWKYTSGTHPVYVFVDIPMNGNFKLVYAENDEQETTNPNWKNYLGSDFDESRLEN